MYCTRCGSKIDSGEFFCPYCGHPTKNPTAEREEPTLERTIERPAPVPVLSERQRAAARRDKYRDSSEVSRPRESEYDPRYSDVSRYQSRSNERTHSRGVIIALSVALALALFIVAVLLVPRLFGGRDRAQVVTPTTETTVPEGEATETEEPEAATPEQEAEPEAEQAEEEATEPEPEETEEPASTPVSDGDFVLPDSSTRYYSAEELQGLSVDQLEIARNEIYARHGRGFNSQALRSYFEAQDWYEERYTPEEFDALSPTPLNQYEQANVATILEVEQSKR